MTNKGCAIRRSAGTDGGALAVTMVSIQLPREVMANRMTNQRAHSGFYVLLNRKHSAQYAHAIAPYVCCGSAARKSVATRTPMAG